MPLRAPLTDLIGSAFRRSPSGAGADRLNFIIAGGQRCGTSSMVRHLSAHPEIGFIAEKELVHEGEYVGWPFASPVLAHFQRGYDVEVYRSMAAKFQGRKKIVATKQPYFMAFPHVPFGLCEQLPDAKLLFILRPQPQAIHSVYKISKSQGRMKNVASFADLVRWDPEQAAEEQGAHYELPEARGRWYREYWQKTLSDPEKTPFLLDRYFYYEQLARFFRVFPREQMLVLDFNRFVDAPAETLGAVCRFLGVDETFAFPEPEKAHSASPASEPISDEVRAAIESFYAASNARLFELLDWPRETWS